MSAACWEVPAFSQTLTCVLCVCLDVIVWMLLLMFHAQTSVYGCWSARRAPPLDCGVLISTISPGVWRRVEVEVVVVTVVVGGGGVAEVTAILLAAYFAKNSLFPKVKHTHKMLTQTNTWIVFLLLQPTRVWLQNQPYREINQSHFKLESNRKSSWIIEH